LVEKTDRLYRNFRDYTELDAEQMGLSIHLVKEGVILSKDSKSGEKFIHAIKVVMAKNYIDNLSEEVRKGQGEKASQGIWPSCAPIGYLNKLDDHTVVPDPAKAPLIKKAFELASTSLYSLSKLKRILYQDGLRSSRAGRELGKEAMARVLRNPIYYGSFSWKGTLYPGKHTPLISKPLFDKTQEAMGYIQRPKLTKHNFTYSGLLTCGHCGCAVTAEQKRKKSGITYIYYHCTNGKGTCDNVVFLREEILADAFAKALQRIQVKPDVVEWTRQALLESSKAEQEFRETSIKSLTTRYQKLDSYISIAYDDNLAGRIGPKLWETKTAQWKLEQQDIEIHLQAQREASTAYLVEGVRLMELASRAADIFGTMNVDEKREMLSLILSNPQVKDGSVRYDYKMPFSMFASVTDLNEWRGVRDSNPRPSA
jgi:site-specific DNA recombinase